ncbi:MAG: bifunctional folylpolyglutamate synthase/dihydrofolate synthase, partial [Fusobacteriaceae bacterium]
MRETVKKIYSYIGSGEKKGLENMKIFKDELKWKKPSYKIIHVAGTNGKGSVSATLEHILFKSGYNVGKFTSPHILRVNERIALNKNEIEDSIFIELFKKIEGVIKKRGLAPTFFEIMTAMMIEYFSCVDLDYLILETGIGGRLDSTNILDGDYAVITNIGYDHTEMLGDTLEKIGYEKSGIVKSGAYVVLCEAEDFLIEEIKKNNPLKIVDAIQEYSGFQYFLDFKNFKTVVKLKDKDFYFSLFGKHQVKNFLTAYAVLKLIGIEDNVIEKNIDGVNLSCRFEIMEKNPLVILDGAHNSHGMRSLAETIKSGYHPDDVMVITTILKDKDIREMV